MYVYVYIYIYTYVYTYILKANKASSIPRERPLVRN